MSRRRTVCRFVLLAVCATALAGPGRAQDLIYPKKGKPIRGRIIKHGDDGCEFNIYGTAVKGVVHGRESLAAKKLKKVVEDPDPHRSFWRRAKALNRGTPQEWVALGQEALKAKLKGLARHAFIRALELDRTFEPALKALGSSAKHVLVEHPRLNDELRKGLEKYLLEKDPGARADARQALRKIGATYSDDYFERAFRSAQQKRGRREDQVLTLRSKEHKGKYTLFVPTGYDPFSPTPLIVGLHGGGRGGKDGKAVVGSGVDAMNFYQREAAQRGWIVVCPTALAAPWGSKVNVGFVQAVIDEVKILFNVDENRIYLAGHSMGGYGSWFFGPHRDFAHQWAAIGPASGGGGGGLSVLKKTRTGVYLHHGANDHVCGVGSDRNMGEQMRSKGMDFVYCELPDSGHGWPDAVREEMFQFFEVRRLAVTKGRRAKGRFRVSQLPHGSFLAKVSKDEKKYFGDPGAGAGQSGASLKDLLADLKAGGGLAEKAAEQLGNLKKPAAATAVGKVLGSSKSTPDVRRFAVAALRRMGIPRTRKPLQKALVDDDLRVASEAFAALADKPDASDLKALKRGVLHLVDSFDGKRQGTRMSYPDFEAHTEAAGARAKALARHGGSGVVALVDKLAQGILLRDLEVRKLARAGHFPDRLRAKLASQLVDAIEKLADASSAPVLEALAANPTYKVADRAKAILAKLAQPR